MSLSVGIALCFAPAASADSVPVQGALRDAAGAPLTATVGLELRIYHQLTGGTAQYVESHPGLSVVDGRFHVSLGKGTPLFGSFGDALFAIPAWIEWVVDGEVLTPRQPLSPAARALGAQSASSALSADTLAGVPAAGWQRRVVATCPTGSSIRSIAADGTVVCQTDSTTGGDINGVTTQPGLLGGGTSGDLTISVDPSVIQLPIGDCPENTFIRAINQDGSVVCESDSASGGVGTITEIAAGSGIMGGATSETAILALVPNGVSLYESDAVTSAKIALGAVSEGKFFSTLDIVDSHISMRASVRVECQGECGDSTLGAICDAIGSGWEPYFVSCDQYADSGSFPDCNTPGSGPAECNAVQLNRSTSLGTFCSDGGGFDAVVFCVAP